MTRNALSDSLILIIEDNERNRKLVRDVLQYHGFQTMEASTGAEGIVLARQQRPRLVLMDIQLPDIDGISALHRIREAPGAYMGCVVALTAYAMKDDEAKFARAGFDGYISKPIDIHLFPDEVRHYCSLSKETGVQLPSGPEA